jgi:hypothetical protein
MKVEKECSYHLVMVSATQSSKFLHYKINLILLLAHGVCGKEDNILKKNFKVRCVCGLESSASGQDSVMDHVCTVMKLCVP